MKNRAIQRLKPSCEPQSQSHGWRDFLGPAALLIGLVFLVYSPTLNCGFIWDDDDYVTENQTLRDWNGLKRIWMDPSATPQYYPLVHTSLWLDYQRWQLWAGGYHATNFVLHAVVSLLVWILLKRIKVPAAWFGAALFAIHPVHVESVAWITERKNVLSGVFGLGAMICMLDCLAIPIEGGARKRAWYYGSATLLFVAALLSKSVTCTIPVILIGLVWYQQIPRQKMVLWMMLPWLVMGGLSGWLTTYLERAHVGARGTAFDFTLAERCVIAGRSVWFYWQKLLVPQPLSFMVPRWSPAEFTWVDALYPISVLLLVCILGLASKRLGRGSLFAVGCFLVTIFPALGFINIYPMRYTFVADHYQYLASISMIALVASASSFAARWLTRGLSILKYLPWVGAAWIAYWMLLAWTQTHIYRDTETLWSDTLNKNPNCFAASYHLGKIRTGQERIHEATLLFQQTLRNQTDQVEEHDIRSLLGNSLSREGRQEEAREQFETALQRKPKYLPALNGLGKSWTIQKNFEKAADYFQQAVAAVPGNVDAQVNLANAYADLGKWEDAEQTYQRAIELDGSSIVAYLNLGKLYARQGRMELALPPFEKASRIDPNSVEVQALLTRVRRELAKASAPK